MRGGRDSGEMCVRHGAVRRWGGDGGGGEDVRAVVAAAGEMRPLPSPVQMDLDYPIFFHPIQSNPHRSKAMDIHIQLDPNPIKFMGQNSFRFGFSPIHSQEYVLLLAFKRDIASSVGVSALSFLLDVLCYWQWTQASSGNPGQQKRRST